MAKRPRRTIGNNPLDAVVPVVRSEALEASEPLKKASVAKERLTIHLPLELIERVKNAVYWTPGLTLAGLGEEALREAVDRLEAERGDSFPPRRDELRGGRPLK